MWRLAELFLLAGFLYADACVHQRQPKAVGTDWIRKFDVLEDQLKDQWLYRR